MFHGYSYGAEINPWVGYQRRPWRSRGFLRSGAADCLLNVVTPIVTFTTAEDAVRLARMCWSDSWGGSATGNLYVRSRGAVLEEWATQFTHDVEGAGWIPRLDALCPPHSQIEISFLNLTDGAVTRPIFLLVSGWLEPWPGHARPGAAFRGEVTR
jgi:hypothetical protein